MKTPKTFDCIIYYYELFLIIWCSPWLWFKTFDSFLLASHIPALFKGLIFHFYSWITLYFIFIFQSHVRMNLQMRKVVVSLTEHPHFPLIRNFANRTKAVWTLMTMLNTRKSKTQIWITEKVKDALCYALWFWMFYAPVLGYM